MTSCNGSEPSSYIQGKHVNEGPRGKICCLFKMYDQNDIFQSKIIIIIIIIINEVKELEKTPYWALHTYFGKY